MKIYMCELCKKIFKQKSHYDKHVLNKKRPCSTINIVNNNETLLTVAEILPKRSKSLPKVTKILPKPCETLPKNTENLLDIHLY